jgi:sarcosine oxidase subunit gamma
LIARLGVTEFLVEAQAEVIEPLQQAARVERVYPVPRQDAALLLCGQRIPELLLQVCSFNFRDAANAEQLVVLTSMVGVSVVAIPMRLNGAPVMRLWCDGSFGPYLWTTLVGICEELGGGAAGLAAMPID